MHMKMKQLTSLCPLIVFSNFPSYAPHIFINLSAATTRYKVADTQDTQTYTHVHTQTHVVTYTHINEK